MPSFLTQMRRPMLGVVADSGQVARAAVRAGADFLMALSAGVYRNQGLSPLAACLPFRNSNDMALAAALTHILPAAPDTPTIIGILAGAPDYADTQLLAALHREGAAGITNYPSVTLIDGNLRAIYEDQGCTIAAELKLLRAAQEHGLTALAFIDADPKLARRYASAGVDALILTPGLTQYLEDIHERRDKLERASRRLSAALQAARAVRRDLVCLAFGGPIALPEDLEHLYRTCDFDGFVGGSVFGRLPVESSVTATIRRFKQVTRGSAAAPAEAPAGERVPPGLGPIIGAAPAMRQLFTLIERAAACELSVCLEGESGVGKELVATQIHRQSSRAAGPLVTLNCGAIPDTLLESELFGHERGAFTGADRRRLGKFELADQGTLFLDEVADLSLHGQVALLRALQQREITRVGGGAAIPVDVRIVAASNQPLGRLQAEGKFRPDLYYRLNQLTLRVPPLRERLDDLPLLVPPLLAALRAQMNRPALDAAPEFLDKLRAHAWPGNLRELQHVLCQAALQEDGPLLTGAHFTPRADAELPTAPPTRRRRAEAALQLFEGNKSRAAAHLGITRKTLYAWLGEAATRGM